MPNDRLHRGGTTPNVHVEGSQLTIKLGVAAKATNVGQLKAALLADQNIQSVTTDSKEEEDITG